MGTNRIIKRNGDRFSITEVNEAEITYLQLVDAKKSLEERKAKMLADIKLFDAEIAMVTKAIEDNKELAPKEEKK